MTRLTPCLPTDSSAERLGLVRGTFWALRCVLASALVLLEPLVTFVLTTLGALGLLTAGFVSIAVPQVPLGHVPVLIAVSLACFAGTGAYFALMAWLQPNDGSD